MQKDTNKNKEIIKQTQPIDNDKQLSGKSDGNRNIITSNKIHQIPSILKPNLTKKPSLRLQNYSFQQSQSKNVSTISENPQSMTILQLKNISIQEMVEVIPQFTSRQKNTQNKMQCVLCAQMFEQESFHSIFQCKHFYCKGCLQLYCKTYVNAFKILKCPDGDCQKAMTEKGYDFLNFNPLIKQKYEIVKFRIEIQNNPSLTLCPNQNCKKGSIVVKKGQKNGRCVQCNKKYCLNCKAAKHTGKCSDFEEMLLKDKFGYKRCPNCKSFVQRISGCPHMTCRCRSNFCYNCGTLWSFNHQCIRVVPRGNLVTEKIYDKLSCIRSEALENEYTFIGYLSKIPTFLLCFLFMVIYVSWCLLVLLSFIFGLLIISIIVGYIKYMIQFYKKSKVIFILGIIFLPVSFFFCILLYAYEYIDLTYRNHLTDALSGNVFPFSL